VRRIDAIAEAMDRVFRKELRLVDPYPPQTFLQYLRRLAYSLWLWISIAMLALTLITIALTSVAPSIQVLRYVLGSIFTLFLPGFALIEALYPDEERLKPIEKLALSLGLSLAVVPLLGLLLNYTPWGIRLGPITTALSIFTATLLFTAAYRKYTLIKLTQSSRFRGAEKRIQ